MLNILRKKVEKRNESRFYLIACQILRENGYKPVRVSYVYNKETCSFEKKDFADINMLYEEHIFNTKEELLESIHNSFQITGNSAVGNSVKRSKDMKHFLSNAIGIGIVEEYISENDESFSIKSRYYPLRYSGAHTKKGQVIKDAELIIVEKGD